VLIKVFYVVLVLCTIALSGAVAAAYLKIRRHMREGRKAAETQERPRNASESPKQDQDE